MECGSKDLTQPFVKESPDILHRRRKLENIKTVDRLEGNPAVAMEAGYGEAHLGYCRSWYGPGCLISFAANAAHTDERWREDELPAVIFMILPRSKYRLSLYSLSIAPVK